MFSVGVWCELMALMSDLTTAKRGFSLYINASTFASSTTYRFAPTPFRCMMDPPPTCDPLATAHGSRDSRKILEDTQDSLRAEIAALSRRRGVGCRGLFDLPDELLLAIFQFVDGFDFDPSSRSAPLGPYRRSGDDDEDPPPMYCCGRTRVPDIKNIRLVCRRFSTLAAGLLVRLVRVYPTAASLARFDAISRHPTISKGVRGVLVVLHFSDFQYLDFRSFIARHSAELRDHLARFETSSRADERRSIFDADDALEVIESARKAYSIVHHMRFERAEDDAGGDYSDDEVDGESAPSPEGEAYEVHRQRIRGIHQQLRRRDTEDRPLLSTAGGFAQGMGTAMARLPGPLELGFGDGDFVRLRELMVGYGIDVWDALHRRMLQPPTGPECSRRVSGVTCDELIPDIITAAGQAGASLGALRLDLTIQNDPIEIGPKPDACKAITSGMPHLHEFSFSYLGYAGDNDPYGDLASYGLYEFLAACLDMPNLRKVTVDLGHYAYYEPNANLADILGTRARPCLTDLTLRGFTVELPYLVQLLEGLPERLDGLHLESVCLDEGTWREALDVLRTKIYSRLRLEDLDGAECDDMPRGEYDEVFGECRADGATRATLYVMRHDPEAPNPLRKREEEMAD